MHPYTKAALLAAIRAELAADPARYGGKTATEIAAAMAAPVVVQPAPTRQNVPISDVKGYLAARLVIVRLRRDVSSLTGAVRDVAEALLDILSDTQLREFLTADDAKRANVLGMFAALVASGAGGLTHQHYADIEAMTLAPVGPAVVEPPRWLHVIDGISAAPTPPGAVDDEGNVIERHPGYAGPPNAADAALIQEALDG